MSFQQRRLFLLLKKKKSRQHGDKIDNNLNKDQKTGGSVDSNHNGNKNKLSVYFLCVPIYSRQYITKPNFSSHMERVKIGFRNKTYSKVTGKYAHVLFNDQCYERWIQCRIV